MLASRDSEKSSFLMEKQGEIDALDKKLREEREARNKLGSEASEKEKHLLEKIDKLEKESKMYRDESNQLRQDVSSKEEQIKDLKTQLE